MASEHPFRSARISRWESFGSAGAVDRSQSSMHPFIRAPMGGNGQGCRQVERDGADGEVHGASLARAPPPPGVAGHARPILQRRAQGRDRDPSAHLRAGQQRTARATDDSPQPAEHHHPRITPAARAMRGQQDRVTNWPSRYAAEIDARRQQRFQRRVENARSPSAAGHDADSAHVRRIVQQRRRVPHISASGISSPSHTHPANAMPSRVLMMEWSVHSATSRAPSTAGCPR